MPKDAVSSSSVESSVRPNGADQVPAEAEAQTSVAASASAAAAPPATEATEPAATTATPLSEEASPSGPTTVPLPEAEAEVAAPPLDEGGLIGGRYEVESLVSSVPGSNIYRALDTQGYRHCWACGSESSLEGDVYCVECGAELAGRHYRVQEFIPGKGEEPGFPLPEPILRNEVPSLAHAFDLLGPGEDGRSYIVWEDVYGQPLAGLSPVRDADTVEAGMPDGQRSEEQALVWMAQAAGVLANLHAAEIVGCNLSAENFVVQPDDHVVLIDPSGCRVVDPEDPSGDTAHLKAADVRSLAVELERWYLAVRDTAGLSEGTVEEQAAEPTPLAPSAEEATGPLANVLNASLVLARAREGTYPTAADFAEALNEIYEASRPLTDLQIVSSYVTDLGQVRQINEDSLLTIETAILEHEGIMPAGLYVIADGMGGHQSGEVASSIAVRTIGAVINSSLLGPMLAGDPVARDEATCTGLVKQSVMEANRRIADLAHERSSDLGTTVVVALLIGNQLTIANVGDSRIYLWHNGQLSVLTRDHSLVAQLVLAGQIEPDAIYTHPRRNEIYRALGEPRLTADEVDTHTLRLQPGDGLLLCSDGLWDFTRDPEIAGVLGELEENPYAACRALIAGANKAGGEDNISVIFVRVLAGED